MSNGFQEVKQSEPCPACGRGDWCAWNKDRSMLKCERTTDAPPGMKLVKAKDGGGLFKYTDSTPRPMAAPRKAKNSPPRTHSTLDAAIQSMAQFIGGHFVWERKYPGPHDTHVARFNLPETDSNTGKPKKKFRPFHYNGQGYVSADPPGKWPLYRVNELPADGPILVHEGELKADAGWGIGLPSVTSAHGCGSAHKTDWTPLAGREIIVLADNDACGAKYAEEVAAILTALGCKVRIVNLPGLPPKGDIVEWLSPDMMGERDPDTIKAEIYRLAQAAPEWTPTANTPEPAAQEDAKAGPVVLPAYFSAADLLVKYPSQREPIIDGLLRRGEVGNLVSASKANKSWLLLHIGLCIATGQNVFNFATRPGRVLLLDYELAPGTLAKRVQVVAGAMGIALKDIGNRLAIESLRGRRLDIHAMRGYFDAMTPGQFDCIIIDPLYRTFPLENFDENGNADMANLYGMLQGYAERLDAAFFVVHHMSKGDQSGKAVTDLGAGGGSQSRAADAHLALRPHKEEGAAVIAGAIRSFAPFDPFAIRWHYPIWELATDLDPADLKRPPSRRTPPKTTEPPVPPAPTWDVARFVVEFLTMQAKPREAIIDSAISAGITERNARRLLQSAEAQSKAHRWKIGKTNLACFANCPQPKLAEVQDTEK